MQPAKYFEVVAIGTGNWKRWSGTYKVDTQAEAEQRAWDEINAWCDEHDATLPDFVQSYRV